MRAPGVVWALVGLHGLLLVVASVLYPTYRAPDETAHVDMVLALAAGEGYPAVGERQLSRRMLDSHPLVGHDRTGRRTPLQAADAPPRGQRPTFAEIGHDVPSTVPQQMAAHPPLYYLLAAGAVSTVTAVVPGASEWSFDQVVGFLRLFSALLVLPLPLLAYATAQRLGATRPVAVAAAVFPLGIPQLTHIGASVNNDQLLVLLVALATLPLLAAAGGDTRLRTAAAAGGLAGLALLTKGFALFTPLWLAVAFGVGALRGGGRRSLGAGTVAMALATAIGGWWWIRNLVRFGTVQPAGLPSPPPPDGFVPDVGAWLPFFVQRLSVRFWIEPDVLPDGVPPLDLLASLVVVVCCLAAFVAARRERPDALVVALVPLAGLVGIVTFGAWRVYARTGLPVAIHGRYLYAAIGGIAAAVAIGAGALLGQRDRWLPLVALVLATGAQITAGGLAFTTYWGPAGLGSRAAAVLAWSPWPAPLVTAAAAAGAAATVWVAVALVKDARHP